MTVAAMSAPTPVPAVGCSLERLQGHISGAVGAETVMESRITS